MSQWTQIQAMYLQIQFILCIMRTMRNDRLWSFNIQLIIPSNVSAFPPNTPARYCDNDSSSWRQSHTLWMGISRPSPYLSTTMTIITSDQHKKKRDAIALLFPLFLCNIVTLSLSTHFSTMILGVRGFWGGGGVSKPAICFQAARKRWNPYETVL